MNIITVTLPDNNKVFLIDDFFPKQLADNILNFFKQWHEDTGNWQSLPEFSHYLGRLSYTNNHGIVDQVRNYASSDEVVSQLVDLIGPVDSNPGVHFWVDTENYQINPHYDSMPTNSKFYGLQIFFSSGIDYTLGTHFYLDRRVMFNLPLRQNYAYLVDRGDKVLHGLPCAVPLNKNRYSIHLKYQTL